MSGVLALVGLAFVFVGLLLLWWTESVDTEKLHKIGGALFVTMFCLAMLLMALGWAMLLVATLVQYYAQEALYELENVMAVVTLIIITSVHAWLAFFPPKGVEEKRSILNVSDKSWLVDGDTELISKVTAVEGRGDVIYPHCCEE